MAPTKYAAPVLLLVWCTLSLPAQVQLPPGLPPTPGPNDRPGFGPYVAPGTRGYPGSSTSAASQAQTNKSTGKTTGTATAKKPPRTSPTPSSSAQASKAPAKAAGKPPGPATANAPAAVGQIKEVTKAFVEATRTRKVFYDEEEMAEKPGVVILNGRKFVPEETPEPSGASRRHTREPDNFAKPL